MADLREQYTSTAFNNVGMLVITIINMDNITFKDSFPVHRLIPDKDNESHNYQRLGKTS